MARGDGIDRTSVRNMRLTAAQINNTQRHNEREKDSYVNQDIVPEMSKFNVYFKRPSGSYAEMFEQMEQDKTISTRGLKEDAFMFGELIFDVNSAYFYNHDGYEFAKQFYHDTYKSAIEIVGGEQYILSAVMHADERNRAMSESLGEDIFHYHLHVVYVPVVEKQVLWTKRCKDKSLVGTVKETIMQVSMSKKWASKPAINEETGLPLLNKNGKPVLKKSYSILQDDFFQAMQRAGYTDLQRGERGSSEEHLTVTRFKTEQEQARLQQTRELVAANQQVTEQLAKKKAYLVDRMQEAQKGWDGFAPKVEDVEAFAKKYSEELSAVLPEAKSLETGKAYREKKAQPVLEKVLDVLKALYREFVNLKSRYRLLEDRYEDIAAKNVTLRESLKNSHAEIDVLAKEAKEYQMVKRILGNEKIASLIREVGALEKGYKQIKGHLSILER